jgi:hypothetical protein
MLRQFVTNVTKNKGAKNTTIIKWQKKRPGRP